MKRLLLLTPFFLLLVGVRGLNIKSHLQERLFRRAISSADCSSSECAACLEDCSGCGSCRLCGVIEEACQRVGVLNLG